MATTVWIYVLVAVVLVALALGVWFLDASRNKEVEQDTDRLEPDPSDPTRRRH
jgi:hypothetical protein